MNLLHKSYAGICPDASGSHIHVFLNAQSRRGVLDANLLQNTDTIHGEVLLPSVL